MSLVLLKSHIFELDYWDNGSKALTTIISSSHGTYIRPTTEIVDAYNVGTTMRKVYHDGLGGVTFVDVPNTIVLLFKNGGSGIIINFAYYSLTTKLVTYSTLNYTNTTPADFSKLTSIIIDSYCLDTTKKEVYHDGFGGITFITTPNSVDCGFTPPAEGLQVTEKLRVKIDNSCYKNPVFLKWKNSLGGWDQWLFGYDQLVKLKTSSLGNYEVNFTDLETQDTISESRGKKAQESMIIGVDDLTDDELEGVKEIFLSPKVYLINPDLSQKTVEVVEGSFSLKQTINNRHAIELEILLPETFTITQ